MRNRDFNPAPDILRLIANNFTEMVMAFDMGRKLVFVTPAVETLTGYSIAEIESARVAWVHPEDRQRMFALWESLYQGASFQEQEYRLVAKDGRVKWVLASGKPLLDVRGRQAGVERREVDITQRKLAETARRHSDEALRADHDRYRALFEDSPFALWEEDFSGVRLYLDALTALGITDLRRHLSVDRDAVEECVRRVRVLDVNRAAREFYGASSKEELLRGLDGLFDETAFEVFREEISVLAEGRSSFQTEYTARTMNGDERLVAMIVSLADSAREDWSRVIVSFFDVTDRGRLEEQLVQSQKMESLGRLAGGIAHDFNNLLTVINGYTDWMLREVSDTDPWSARLLQVRNAGEHCAQLVQQLLAFSRKQVARPGPLDLNRLIGESQPMLDRILGDDIRVSTNLASSLGTIEADGGQMHQVLMNLAVNARDAMPGGGVLTIKTRNLENPPEVLLEVSDTGSGMDETTRLHLFEPFFTTKSSRKNTGLGLATVFGIVSQGGGRIEVRSQPNEGAAFRIYLPRIAAQAPAPAAVAADPLPVGSGAVLVVEDRDEVRDLTCRMIEQLGYRAIAADSGAQALATLARTPSVAVVLTDVVMPGMSGIEFAEQLQRTSPASKIVFMSGYTDHRLVRPDGSPSAGFLQKPFTLAQLAGALREAVGRVAPATASKL